jgi:hypothetical protein
LRFALTQSVVALSADLSQKERAISASLAKRVRGGLGLVGQIRAPSSVAFASGVAS